MVSIHEEALVISLSDPAPAQRREQLIADLAAAMRWKASSTGTYEADDEAQYRLAQLLEELVLTE